MANANDPKDSPNDTIHISSSNIGAVHAHGPQTNTFGTPPQSASSSGSSSSRPEPYTSAPQPQAALTGGVFISYKSDDRPWVTGVVQDLIQRGVDCWWDQMSLAPGTFWRTEINKGLTQCEAGLLFVSERSLASQEVMLEYRALLHRKPLYLLMLESVQLPPDLAGIQAYPYSRARDLIEFIAQKHKRP